MHNISFDRYAQSTARAVWATSVVVRRPSSSTHFSKTSTGKLCSTDRSGHRSSHKFDSRETPNVLMYIQRTMASASHIPTNYTKNTTNTLKDFEQFLNHLISRSESTTERTFLCPLQYQHESLLGWIPFHDSREPILVTILMS